MLVDVLKEEIKFKDLYLSLLSFISFLVMGVKWGVGGKPTKYQRPIQAKKKLDSRISLLSYLVIGDKKWGNKAGGGGPTK